MEHILKEVITNKYDRELFSYSMSDGIKFARAMSLYELYTKNKNLMKNENIKAADFIDKTKRGKECFENFNDTINKLILKNKSKKLMRSIFSKKYSHLIDERTEQLFLDFSECNIEKEFFRNNISKKIAAFKDSESLNEALSKELNNLSKWNKISKKREINRLNTTIVSEDDNCIIFEVNDYKASEKLGTDMWCIVREKDTFEDYRSDVERVYFKYNFNEDYESNRAMTAYIVNASADDSPPYNKLLKAMVLSIKKGDTVSL